MLEEERMNGNQSEYSTNKKEAKTMQHRKERLNERRIMNCGISAKIIVYQAANNITVKFDDGVIVRNQRYRAFKKGCIAHPEIKCCRNTSINEHIILWYFSKLGFHKAPSGSLKDLGFGKMELDCYNPDLKVAIEYDGVRWHKSDKKQIVDEKKNRICKENNIHLIRIREPGLEPMDDCENFILDTTALFSQSLEQVLNILIHRMNTFVEIDFSKDRKTIMNDFSEKNKFNKVGETSIASNGEKIKILAYRTNQDIDVEFESGVIVKNRRYDHFKEGLITKEPDKYSDKEKVRLGERRLMNCGDYAAIVRYKNTNDIDVMFDNGEIVENRTYQNFKRGQIANPIGYQYPSKRDLRIGETSLSTQGELMTIIDYINRNDITVQFESGAVVEHRRYSCFAKGAIKNPNSKKTA